MQAKVPGPKSSQAQNRQTLPQRDKPRALVRGAGVLCLPFVRSIVRRVFVIVARSISLLSHR